jgi:ketosteroid isomerase-like protein
MRARNRTVLCGLLLVGLTLLARPSRSAAQAPARKLPEQAAARPASDAAQIRAQYRAVERAAVARDVDAIMRLYWHSPKLVAFDVVPPLQYTGWDAYRKDWSDFLASLADPITFEIRDLYVETAGTMAYARCITHIAGHYAKSGQPVEMLLRVSDVWRKHDGRWVIVHEHVSVPVDLGTARAILNAQP